MKLIKIFSIVLCVSMIVMAFVACDGKVSDTTAADTTAADVTGEGGTNGDVVGGDTTVDDGTDSEGETTNSGSTVIPASDVKLTFSGTSCQPSVEGAVTIQDGAFVITKGGRYILEGDLSDGQIRVAVPKTEQVTLVFNGFTASSSTTAPLYIVSADKATIELNAGTVNSLEDAEIYQFANPAETKPNACIYSSDDLTIKGDGTLTVTGNYNNGIGGKNDVRIRGGNVTVSAPNNIVKGNDSVTITGAKVTLSGGEDAIKTDNIDEQGKGYILIGEGAEVVIECSDDALQADQALTVDATAKVSGRCGGDVVNCPGVINVAVGTLTVNE